MTVALATCARADEHGAASDDEPLLAALQRAGIDARMAVWDDAEVDWAGFDAVVVRTTWDYEHQRDRFVQWAADVEAVTRLWNPAEVVRWNTHKGYLIELEERGVPIVPTAWLAQGDTIELAALATSRRWDDGIVVKPAVGAGATGLSVVEHHPGDGQAALDALLADGDVMVQPLVRAISQHGELSVVCIEGAYSHAIRKLPRHGEVRIQEQHGGINTPETPGDEVVSLSEWIVEVCGHDLLYARVDLLPDGNGGWQLGELEATEPSLYLDLVEGAADTLASAITARLEG